ncbi:MAG: hypothetical protein P857_117 [Candidatus Xenolissoclinum pacificiensis L6]|uniref:Uncharacterized protein n=1 Tax=Candidatus Xenolissoclinum pacificiensis L6 TaxID=1401685 RepID=W2V063_9RICK|nr:MAG: hypothetical protein P857_117 [Candidatus Xenolissoclinum pacificiensis L6]
MLSLKGLFELLGFQEQQYNAVGRIFHFMSCRGQYDQAKLTPDDLDEFLESRLADDTKMGGVVAFINIVQKMRYDLRGCGERQEMKDVKLPYEGFNKDVEEYGILDAIEPNKTSNTRYVIFGCAEVGLRKRMNFIKGVLEENKNVICLAGDRALWADYTGSDEQLYIHGESSTFNLIEKLNPRHNIEDIKKQINTYCDKNKQEIINGKLKITKVREEIIKMNSTIKWPTESDLARYLAHEILGIDDVRVVEGEKDPAINRPTTDTTVVALYKYDAKHNYTGYSCFVSNAPHICKQNVSVKKYYPKSDTCGSGVDLDTMQKSSSILEAICGHLFEAGESLRQKNVEIMQQNSNVGLHLTNASGEAVSLIPEGRG